MVSTTMGTTTCSGNLTFPVNGSCSGNGSTRPQQESSFTTVQGQGRI